MKRVWIFAIVGVIALVGIILFFTKRGTENIQKSAPKVAVEKLVSEAAALEISGDKLVAKLKYQQVLSEHPDYDDIQQIEDKMGALSISLIFSKSELPQTIIYEVKSGDSLGKLSKQFGTTKELIKKSNNLTSDVIRVGQKLRIWTAPFSVHVDKSQNTLVLKTGDELVKVYRVSTGANNSTPVGTFHIATRLIDPVWFKAGSQPIPGGSPENELGTRWMGFGEDPHYGIHGTIKPELVGQQATAGCVRLENSQVEELFDLLPVGTSVTIVD